jgi:hypothetical protein
MISDPFIYYYKANCHLKMEYCYELFIKQTWLNSISQSYPYLSHPTRICEMGHSSAQASNWC